VEWLREPHRWRSTGPAIVAAALRPSSARHCLDGDESLAEDGDELPQLLLLTITTSHLARGEAHLTRGGDQLRPSSCW